MNRCNDVSQSMNEEEQHAGMEDAGHWEESMVVTTILCLN